MIDDEKLFLKSIYDHREVLLDYLMKNKNCDHERAETLFVEAAMILRKKRAENTLGEINNLKSYLITVCNNLWMRYYHADKKRREAETLIQRFFYGYVNEYPACDDTDEYKNLLLDSTLEALKLLGEKCKKLLQYFYFENKSMTEIAALMGFNGQAVATATKYRCFNELKLKAYEIKKAKEKNR